MFGILPRGRRRRFKTQEEIKSHKMLHLFGSRGSAGRCAGDKAIRPGEDQETRTETVPLCRGFTTVTLAPRKHLRQAHHLKQEEITKLMAANREEKGKPKPVLRVYPYFRCPIDGCDKIVKRLDGHLSVVHDISKEFVKELAKGA